eukprot:350193-Chlamydomonas_euryale.AAC.6
MRGVSHIRKYPCAQSLLRKEAVHVAQGRWQKQHSSLQSSMRLFAPQSASRIARSLATFSPCRPLPRSSSHTLAFPPTPFKILQSVQKGGPPVLDAQPVDRLSALAAAHAAAAKARAEDWPLQDAAARAP